MEKACLENIQSYLDSCVTPGYSEPWYTENPDIFRIEPWDTQNLEIQNYVKHLRWSIVQKLLTVIVVFAN